MKVLAAVVLAGTLLAQTPEVTRSEQEAGPFLVSGRKLRVISDVHQIQRARTLQPESSLTVAAFRVVDETGGTLFERAFPHEIQGDRFAKTTAVHAETLAGREGSGLLLTYSVLPAVPRGGISWQLLGFVGDKLVPFSKPLAAYGDLAGQEPGRPARANWDGGLEADMLTFRVWTGNFYVFIPLRIDWVKGAIGPGHGCWDTGKPVNPGRCRLDIFVEKRTWGSLSLLRLFQTPNEKSGSPVRISVWRNTRVEFLTAEATLLWVEGKEQTGFGVSDNVWLKVRVDGKEGWIHTQQDFESIGLPHGV